MTTSPLSDFSDLQESVLTPFSGSLRHHRESPVLSKTCKRFTYQRVMVFVAAAAISVSLTLPGVELSNPKFRSPIHSIDSAQNEMNQTPPLGHLFANRFDSEWTKEREEEVLQDIVSNWETAHSGGACRASS